MPASPQKRQFIRSDLNPIHQRLQTCRDVTDTAYADVRVVGEHVRTAGAEGVLAENQVPLVGGSRVGSAGEVERAVVHDEVSVLVGWAVHAHGVAAIRGGQGAGCCSWGCGLVHTIISLTRHFILLPTRSLTVSLVHSPVHSFNHSVTHSLTHSLVHSSAHSFIHSPTHSFAHSSTHSVTRSSIHSPTHPLVHPLAH